MHEFIARYRTAVVSRLVLSLLDLLGSPNVDTVEKTGPRSSVGQGESTESLGNQEYCAAVGQRLDKTPLITTLPGGVDADLRAIIMVWQTLPAALRSGIMAMVTAAKL